MIRYRVTRDNILMPFKIWAFTEDYPSDSRLELNIKVPTTVAGLALCGGCGTHQCHPYGVTR